MTDLLRWVDNLKDVKVVVIGDLMLDRYTECRVTRISPEAPVPVLEEIGDTYSLGGCGNTAYNVVSMGGTVYLIGAVGNDGNGDHIRSKLSSSGINDMTLQYGDGRRTTRKQRFVSRGHQIMRSDKESTSPISLDLQKKVVNSFMEIIPEIDVVILSDYAKGFLTGYVCRHVINAARDHGKPIIVDPKNRFSIYSGATVITPNLSELIKFGGVSALPDKPYNWKEVHSPLVDEMRYLMQNNDIGSVMATLSEHGMALFDRDRYYHVSAIRDGIDVIDIAGAGDTSIALFSMALGIGRTNAEAMRIANYAAGAVVQKHGTSSLTMEDLKETIVEEDDMKSVDL